MPPCPRERDGGRRPPEREFGTNAALLRVNAPTYNLLTARERLALPGDLWTVLPKRLRFLLFNTGWANVQLLARPELKW